MEPLIDWYSHYKNKFSNFDFNKVDTENFYEQDKIFIDYILSLKTNKIIEAGAGLARDSLVLASKGISVTLFDIDERFLEIGNKNAKHLGLENLIDTKNGDLFQFSKAIPKGFYGLSFSCGVLEHFEDQEIREILQQQLQVVPSVVFTVPILSNLNQDYFKDALYRRLLPIEEWIKLLEPFNIIETINIKGRHEDLLVMLSSKTSVL